jgi:hypothetical protein
MAKAKTKSKAAPMNRTISWVKRISPVPSDKPVDESFSEVPAALVRVRSE